MVALNWRKSPRLHRLPAWVAKHGDEVWRVDPPVGALGLWWHLSVRVPGGAAIVMSGRSALELKGLAERYAGQGRQIVVSNSPYPLGRSEVAV